MDNTDDLFDALDPRWRDGGATSEPCAGLEVTRFGAGRGDMSFKLLEVQGKGHRLFVAADAQVRNLRLFIQGEACTVFLGGEGMLRGLSLRLMHKGSVIALGRKVTTAGVTMVAGEGRRIVVEEDCLFSHGIWVRNTDMHPIYRIADGERMNPAADVVIGRHVWIGQDVKMSKGATIGPDSVIGTSAVVSGAIPANCVAAGVPAKVLQQGTRWDRVLNADDIN
jgi:carbonic anhydrase/acetyltransferase-like protein (isoleucine patch superfamily)